MPALDAALALSQAGDRAELVGKNLELDVVRVLHILFHVEVPVSKGGCSFRLGCIEQSRHLFFGANNSHTASAASRRSLNDYRKTHGTGPFQGLAVAAENTVRARKNGDTSLLHRPPRLLFFAHEASDFRMRPNKFHIAGFAHFGKVCVFGKQPVAGMDCIHICDFRRADDRRDIEIALRELRRADANSLICKAHVERIAVGLAIDRNRADAQLLAGANYPQSDFTAVSNQDLFEHGLVVSSKQSASTVTIRSKCPCLSK